MNSKKFFCQTAIHTSSVLFVLSTCQFSGTETIASESSKQNTIGTIGYGSSTAIITAKIQEGFLMGFELGIRKILGLEKARQIVRVNQVSSSSQLGALQSASELVRQNVASLFGFPGSHDALLAGDALATLDLMAMFPGCNHNGLRELGPDVYTTGHSMDVEVESLLTFIERNFPGKRALVIINPTAAPSFKSRSHISKVRLAKKITFHTSNQGSETRFESFASLGNTSAGDEWRVSSDGNDAIS